MMTYEQARIEALEAEVSKLREELAYLHILYQKLLE